jgi:hypothetical protein
MVGLQRRISWIQNRKMRSYVGSLLSGLRSTEALIVLVISGFCEKVKKDAFQAMHAPVV